MKVPSGSRAEVKEAQRLGPGSKSGLRVRRQKWEQGQRDERGVGIRQGRASLYAEGWVWLDPVQALLCPKGRSELEVFVF